MKISMKHLKQFGCFSAVSVSSALIDIGFFEVFVLLLRAPFPSHYILMSTAAARILSSLFNFTMNRWLVFHSKEKPQRSAPRYFALVIVQMLCSAFLVTGLCQIVPFPEAAVKALVDTFLFLISFQIQKRIIFS